MADSFHRRSGSLVTVTNNGRTAQRSHPEQEFNNGVVLSAEPIRDNHVFEVKIDRKVLLLPISGLEIYAFSSTVPTPVILTRPQVDKAEARSTRPRPTHEVEAKAALIIFSSCGFFYLSIFFSSPNLSCRRLDVCHTSTHSVASVRI